MVVATQPNTQHNTTQPNPTRNTTLHTDEDEDEDEDEEGEVGSPSALAQHISGESAALLELQRKRTLSSMHNAKVSQSVVSQSVSE